MTAANLDPRNGPKHFEREATYAGEDANVGRAIDQLIDTWPVAEALGADRQKQLYRAMLAALELGQPHEGIYDVADWFSFVHFHPNLAPDDIKSVTRLAIENSGKPDAPEPVFIDFTASKLPDGSINPFRAKSPAEFRRRTANDELVAGLLDRGTVSGLIAKPKAGKSFLALDLALAIAQGRPWLGRTVKQGLALFIAAEGSAETEHRALALMAHRGDDLAAAPFRCISASPDFLNGVKDADLVAAAVAAAEDETGHKAELIVVDTLRQTMHRGDENGSDMADYARHVRHLANKTGAHVMILHHTGKDPAKGARGHSSLEGELDSILLIDGGKLIQHAQRARECGYPIGFVLAPIQAVVHGETMSTVAPMLTGVDAASEFGRKPLRPGSYADKAHRLLADMIEAEGSPVSAALLVDGAPEGGRVVSESEWRDAVKSRIKPKGAGKWEMPAFHREYRRLRANLFEENYAGFSQGFIWLK